MPPDGTSFAIPSLSFTRTSTCLRGARGRGAVHRHENFNHERHGTERKPPEHRISTTRRETIMATGGAV
jgi:hypothetical protein